MKISSTDTYRQHTFLDINVWEGGMRGEVIRGWGGAPIISLLVKSRLGDLGQVVILMI